VIHVLVSSAGEELVEALRRAAPPSAVFLHEITLDETLERLARSARVDAVVTDDPEVVAAIREEIPGNLRVVLMTSEDEAPSVLRDLLPG
jgi:hypothetical protein